MQSTGQGPAPYKTKGTPNTASPSPGQTTAPHKADEISHRPKGPDAAIQEPDAAIRGPDSVVQSIGRVCAPYIEDGASHRPKQPDSVTRSKGQVPAPYETDGGSNRPKGPKKPKGPDAVTQNKGQAPPLRKAEVASSTRCWRTGLIRGRACGTGPDNGPCDPMRHDCL